MIYLLFIAVPLLGQTLRVSSASGSSGESLALDVSMDSPAAQRPSILKWETIFPAQLLEVDPSGPEVGGLAKESGKSLTCTLRQSYAYICILAGGQKPIGNGRIAIFRFKIRAGARTGTAAIRIDQVEAATVDLQSLKFVGSEGHVEVH